MVSLVSQGGKEAAADGVVERVAALLDAFTIDDRGLTVAELARRAGLPRSTTHRLVAQLVGAGLLQYQGSRVQLWLKLFELGHLVPEQRSLASIASPHLHDLRDATRRTTSLAIVDGTDIVYLERVPAPHSPTMPFRSGQRLSAHATALGKAIMAHLPNESVDRMCASGLPAMTRHTITRRTPLGQVLAAVRETGLAYDLEEAILGFFCVASPIFDRRGMILGAVSATCPGSRAQIAAAAPAVRTAALNLTRGLGRTFIGAASDR